MSGCRGAMPQAGKDLGYSLYWPITDSTWDGIMTFNQAPDLDPWLGVSMVPIEAATAYCKQIEGGYPAVLYLYDRALSRAINTFNARLLNHGLQALTVTRLAMRHAQKVGVPEVVFSATDSVLARQEAALSATARETVGLAYAY